MPVSRRPLAPRAGAGVLALGAVLAAVPPASSLARARLGDAPAGYDATRQAPVRADTGFGSADWLSLLPDGDVKRRFVLDCTGCHVFDGRIARPGGRARTETEWRDAATRMVGSFGATSGFPVISSYRDPVHTATWLTQVLGDRTPAPRAGPPYARAEVTEFPMPNPQDLPHDVAVDADGMVQITGMFSHVIWTLDPASGQMTSVAIPEERANPRAIEIAPNGDWWLVLGARHMIARYEPSKLKWSTYPVGFYAHSVALAPDGSAWGNGHFTKSPELLRRVDAATGQTTEVQVPPHPTLGTDAGGPIPYEIRAGADGRIWMTELQGNRLVVHDPARNTTEAYDLPVSFAGPRRHDLDRAGTVWVPAYSANTLFRFDPRTRRWQAHELPVRDAVPYVARVHPRTGRVWVGTAAADAVFEFDPTRRAWNTYALPSRGAMVRHMAFDPRNGDVWLAYGASPGIAARVARVKVQ
jgi:streptogramin lyase